MELGTITKWVRQHRLMQIIEIAAGDSKTKLYAYAAYVWKSDKFFFQKCVQ